VRGEAQVSSEIGCPSPRMDARQEKGNGEGMKIHILDTLGLEAMEEVSVLVLQVGQHLPYDQLSGTALAAALTLALTPSEAWSPVLYGTPKTATTKDLLTTHGLAFEPKEWLVDFVVMDRRSGKWCRCRRQCLLVWPWW
jgi:hypothetical protein